ncbi:hypothetical protein PILCRDRAFT_812538 [Piloderma croceum F 1598]|uniref:Uncharacterized protein n=1 Tax=Piloderma croceum (strain F 1598) TaxID=765440 RepID=A0A0C3CJ56_PILCF|nr:hypothetical protein PILCRDRAFT_812538 [Piloderma croceum F 1598]
MSRVGELRMTSEHHDGPRVRFIYIMYEALSVLSYSIKVLCLVKVRAQLECVVLRRRNGMKFHYVKIERTSRVPERYTRDNIIIPQWTLTEDSRCSFLWCGRE